MEDLFQNLGINGKLFLAQAINFLILFWILHKIVFKRLFAFLEQRRNRIEKGIEFAAKAEQEMQRINEARHVQIENAKKEGEKILAENKAAALLLAKETADIAKKEAEKIVMRAKEDAIRASHDAIRGAEEEIRDAAFLLAQKVLSRALTKQDEEKFAKEALGEIENVIGKYAT